MHVSMMTVVFQLPGCRSLKEKRQRLSGIRERFGRQTNVAVCESGHADDLSRAQWSFIASSSNRKIVDKTLSQIEESLDTDFDAVIIRSDTETL